jgi:cell division control protein 6
VRRLPQRIKAKLILVFASNRLDWPDHLDPRVRSFLKLNELIFKPYDAMDLQQILRIRAEKALQPGALEAGVIEKIAGLASRDHGDARQAVALLARGAYLAEKAGSHITLELVDEGVTELDRDRYLTLIRSSPPQLQAALAAIIEASVTREHLGSGEAYDAYQRFCGRVSLRPLTGRAFGDLVAELDMYSFIRSRVLSKGRYGRTREITLDLPGSLVSRLREAIMLNFQVRG